MFTIICEPLSLDARLTLAITRPRIFLAEEGNLAEAAQVNGGVS
jgi:hypothetical protein